MFIQKRTLFHFEYDIDLKIKVDDYDFNLNKVAELQGVKVLNINELANALKPVVMPGEIMEVKL